MSKLNQLRQLSESHPVYFFHMYQKELQRAESRNNTNVNQTQEDQPEVEGEWTAEEKEQERKRIHSHLKEGNPVPKSRGKAVHSRP